MSDDVPCHMWMVTVPEDKSFREVYMSIIVKTGYAPLQYPFVKDGIVYALVMFGSMLEDYTHTLTEKEFDFFGNKYLSFVARYIDDRGDDRSRMDLVRVTSMCVITEDTVRVV